MSTKTVRSPAAKLTGIVKWFSDAKGYGFIAPDPAAGQPTPKDIFVHFSGIESEGRKTLAEGQRVTFAVTDTAKGLTAIQVRTVA